ncbi:MAG: hypothetical protein KDK08_00305 [Rhizobiaceae bacterium]|nr:hypothetical protein [Rhizobiaceae bacterium]
MEENMPQPIATAPKDGTKITVHWTDRDGVENTSIAQYRAPEHLKAFADWNEGDVGWWAYIESDIQQRIDPHSWSSRDEVEEDEG